MADISDINSAQSVKIIGSDATGVEQTPVTSTSAGGIHTNLRNNAGTEIATSSNPVRIDPTGTTSQPVNNTTASNLNAQVVGNVAAASADSGNPVKIGGIYNTTPPTLTSGQRGNAQLDENSVFVISENQVHYTAQQKVFSASSPTFNVGTSETPAFLFRNPSGSGVKTRIFRFFLNLSGSVTYRFYHTPTITTNGTSITPVNQKITSAPLAASALPSYSPTISANGTLLWQYTTSAQNATKDLELPHHLIIDANFNMLITAQAGANNTPIALTVLWYEVA